MREVSFSTESLFPLLSSNCLNNQDLEDSLVLYNFCALEHTLVYNGIAVFGACTSDSLSNLQVTHVFTLNFQSLKEKELHIIISYQYTQVNKLAK